MADAGPGRDAGRGGSPPRVPDLDDCRRHADWALLAAWGVELGVFDALAGNPAGAEEVAERLSVSPRGAEILLQGLVGLGALRREEGEYRVTGSARARFVDRDTPDFERGAVRLWLKNARTLATGLGDAVRRGEPLEADRDAAEDEEERRSRFMAAMADKDPALVSGVADGCLERVPDARRALDVGGGPGVFARALARRGLRVTLLDRPEVVEHVAEEYDLASHEKIRLEGGDFLESLPPGEFDLVLLANITHIHSPSANADLLARAARSLRAGGCVAILDFVRGVSSFAPLFAVTMLLNTEEGNTYARSEYERWLDDAGFTGTRVRSVDPDRQLVTALRRGPQGS